MNNLEQLHFEATTSEVYVASSHGRLSIADTGKAASKSAEITEQIAIEFAEWVDNMGYTQVANGLYKSLSDEKGKSTKELFQEFLKTKQ